MDRKSARLIASAAELYRLGLDVESARDQLRRLAEQGVRYDSEEMRKAYQTFLALDRRWRESERRHLALRDEITQR